MDNNSSAGITRAAVRPGYSAGHFALEIDGRSAGYLSSVEGGEAAGEVVVFRQGGEIFARKSIGAVIFTDVALSVALPLDPGLAAWISDTLQRRNLRRDISVLTLDADLKVRTRDDFSNALITELTIPKMDGTSKETAFLTLKIAPEYARSKKGDGSKLKTQTGPAKKKWLASNFRLNIGGLDCSKVAKIDSITLKQVMTQAAVGEQRDYARQPAQMEISHLCVSLSDAAAQTFVDWHEDFVVKGNNGSDREKKGTLTLLSADLITSLGEISFSNLGIFRLSRGKREVNSDQIWQVRAEMYIEQIGLILGDNP